MWVDEEESDGPIILLPLLFRGCDHSRKVKLVVFDSDASPTHMRTRMTRKCRGRGNSDAFVFAGMVVL